MPPTPPNNQVEYIFQHRFSLSLSRDTDTDADTVVKSNMDKGNNAKATEYDVKGYALSGKVMLISIIILFIIIVIMLCIHAYARWYLHRTRRIRRSNHRSRASRSHLIFYVDPSVTAATRGLDAAVIASLPVFGFSSKTHPDPVVDCPVCLSEFEEGETGRVLPKCNHTFHTECIDMWFQSHSTCPLCRAPVEPLTLPELVVTVCEPQTGSSSGLCEEWKLGADELKGTEPAGSSSTTSSTGLVRKPSSLVGVSVEVPGRNNESVCDSPSLSFRSPMSSVMSLKRILSRERKASVSSSSSGCAAGCSSSTAEFDAERGERVEIQ